MFYMKATFLFFFFAIASCAFAQSDYQVFKSAGFKVKCPCTLRVNSSFIQMVKTQGKTVICAYLCAENEDSPEYGVIHNINIYNEADSYVGLAPNQYAYFEKKYLEAYAKQLGENGMSYKYITYKGVSALEYLFDQMGVPTKAIMFLKNKKSYLIQVATRSNLETKFNSVKTSFEII